MIRKTLAALGVAAVMLLGLGGAPAAAVPQQQAALVDTCADESPGANTLRMANSFRCLGDTHDFDTGPSGPLHGVCINMTTFAGGAHPAPNGFSNIMSSAYNGSPYRIQFYDAFNCAVPILFAMNPFTYRDTLNDLANNKASSIALYVWP